MKNIIKTTLLITVFLFTAGCKDVVLRKDLYEKTSFKSENIKAGKNKIEIYSLEYPKSYRERLDYMKDFEDMAKELLLEDKSLNLLISREMYDTIKKLKNQEFLPEEEVYLKNASDLDQFQRDEIDRDINIPVTDLRGDIQKYLDKQVYFWMVLNNRANEFNSKNLYTELDKQRLIEEIRETRKEFSQILNKIKVDFIIKEYNPYSVNDGEYQISKEIDLFNPTDIPRDILNEKNALYLKGIKDEDQDKIIKNMVSFTSSLIILESKEFTGYSVKDGKYLFFHGGSHVRNYYKGYDFRVEITESSIIDLAESKEGILLEDLFDRVKPEINSLETEENEIQKKTVNWVID
jgi:hypothetical protein